MQLHKKLYQNHVWQLLSRTHHMSPGNGWKWSWSNGVGKREWTYFDTYLWQTMWMEESKLDMDCVCTQYLSLVQTIQLIHDTDGVPQIMYIPKNMLCLIVKMCNLNSHACHVDWVSSKTFNLSVTRLFSSVTRLHHHCNAMQCNATQCNALLVGAISDSVLWLHGKYADAPDCTNLSTLLIVEKSSLVIAQICRPPRLHKLIWLHTLIRPDTDTDTTTVEVCRRFCTNKLETTTLIHLYVLLVSLIAASAPCEKHFSPSKYHWNHHIQIPHPISIIHLPKFASIPTPLCPHLNIQVSNIQISTQVHISTDP